MIYRICIGMDIGLHGATTQRGSDRIEERLDRFCVNNKWLDEFRA